MVDEFDVRERVTDVEGHVVSPVRADRRRQCRLEVGGPLVGAAAAWTRRALGLTMWMPPTTTVGTVSLPLATDRTKAAASESSQMLISPNSKPARRRPTRSVNQYGHPERVYMTISRGLDVVSACDGSGRVLIGAPRSVRHRWKQVRRSTLESTNAGCADSSAGARTRSLRAFGARAGRIAFGDLCEDLQVGASKTPSKRASWAPFMETAMSDRG